MLLFLLHYQPRTVGIQKPHLTARRARPTGRVNKNKL